MENAIHVHAPATVLQESISKKVLTAVETRSRSARRSGIDYCRSCLLAYALLDFAEISEEDYLFWANDALE